MEVGSHVTTVPPLPDPNLAPTPDLLKLFHLRKRAVGLRLKGLPVFDFRRVIEILTVTILIVTVMKERLTVIKGFSVTLCLAGVTLVRFLLFYDMYDVHHPKTFFVSESSQ